MIWISDRPSEEKRFKIELEGAGLQVFEKKKKEPKPDSESTAA